MSRRKVLHLINGEFYAGAEHVHDALGRQLAPLGYEVAYACLKPGAFLNARQTREAQLTLVPMRSRVDLRPAFHLARLVRQEGHQLIHTCCPRTVLIGRLASVMARVPLVHHVHGQARAFGSNRLLNQVNAFMERMSLLAVPAVIAVSDATVRYLVEQHIPRHVIRMVPNGVPVRKPPAPRSRPSGTWTLGMVALFRRIKGLHVLIEAMAHLNARGLPVRLRAVGGFQSPADEEAIRRLAAQHGVTTIDWVGFSSDVRRELDSIDLYVQPSVAPEGAPLALLEAMAAGIAVVGSRVDGITDVIRDGVDGLLAAPGRAEDLAGVIARVITGDRDWGELCQAAWRRQTERFTDTAMAAGVASAYAAVLASAR